MAIISGQDQAAKGTSVTVSLNKSEFFLLPSIANDPYYADPNKTASIRFLYRSVEGNQRVSLVFKDPSVATPTGLLKFSAYARNSFQLKKIFLYDFDGGYLEVAAEDIPTDLNVTLV